MSFSWVTSNLVSCDACTASGCGLTKLGVGVVKGASCALFAVLETFNERHRIRDGPEADLCASRFVRGFQRLGAMHRFTPFAAQRVVDPVPGNAA